MKLYLLSSAILAFITTGANAIESPPGVRGGGPDDLLAAGTNSELGVAFETWDTDLKLPKVDRLLGGGCPASDCDGEGVLSQSLGNTFSTSQGPCRSAAFSGSPTWARCFDLKIEGCSSGKARRIDSVKFTMSPLATAKDFKLKLYIETGPDGCERFSRRIVAEPDASFEFTVEPRDPGQLIPVVVETTEQAIVVGPEASLFVAIEFDGTDTSVAPVGVSDGECNNSFWSCSGAVGGKDLYRPLRLYGTNIFMTVQTTRLEKEECSDLCKTQKDNCAAGGNVVKCSVGSCMQFRCPTLFDENGDELKPGNSGPEAEKLGVSCLEFCQNFVKLRDCKGDNSFETCNSVGTCFSVCNEN